ncbi:hypothetical protein BB560_004941 [Smittium megazygosporum]|uniref:DASH complex subunit DUO1 n=1 Tax=Smittium megazygosporum TaxID=133381 RepID=A0A2T9Z7U3_9FUNG|nr:hypothetical protein BB560_004941 [Smittium megazygosporum]
MADEREQDDLVAISKVFTEITDALTSLQGQLRNFNENVNQTSQILDLWADIMAQTTFNHNIFSEPGWLGGTQDKETLQQLIEAERLEKERQEQRLFEIEQEKIRMEQLRIERELARKEKEAAKPPAHPSFASRHNSLLYKRGAVSKRTSRPLNGSQPTSRQTTQLHKRRPTQ